MGFNSEFKGLKIGSCSKLHTDLKRELSYEARHPVINPTKHMLCGGSLMPVLLSSITNTGQNDFITRSLLWSNMVKCSTPSSADHFRTDLWDDHSMEYEYMNVMNIYRVSRGDVPDFERVFLMLKYTDITQNTYVQSWTVTEIMAREVWNFDNSYTLIDYQIHIKIGGNMWFL